MSVFAKLLSPCLSRREEEGKGALVSLKWRISPYMGGCVFAPLDDGRPQQHAGGGALPSGRAAPPTLSVLSPPLSVCHASTTPAPL